MSHPTAIDPFSSPIGAIPRVYAARFGWDQSVGYLTSRLIERQFATGLTVVGVPGVGKSTALAYLRHDYVARGFLVVALRVRPNQPVEPFLDDAIRDALQTLSGKRERSRSGRGFSMRASAKIPFTPIELELAREVGPDERTDVRRRLMSLLSRVAARGVPVLLIVDEADSLLPETYERYYVDVLGEAAAQNAPMTIIRAVTSAISTPMLYGSTFVHDLELGTRLEPLPAADSDWLLRETARISGQDWSSADLGELVGTAAGIPRRLQNLGSRVFHAARSMPLQRAVADVNAEYARALQARRNSLTPDAHDVLATLAGHGGRMNVWTARWGLLGSSQLDDARSVRAIRELETVGLVQIVDGDLTLTR